MANSLGLIMVNHWAIKDAVRSILKHINFLHKKQQQSYLIAYIVSGTYCAIMVSVQIVKHVNSMDLANFLIILGMRS